MRVCFGQDHQYSIPYALAQELSIDHHSWRDALQVLAEGSYGKNAPPLDHPATFAALFNMWLIERGQRAYSIPQQRRFTMAKSRHETRGLPMLRHTV
jgi:hypothetical protein